MSCAVEVLWFYLGQPSATSGKKTRNSSLKMCKEKGVEEVYCMQYKHVQEQEVGSGDS